MDRDQTTFTALHNVPDLVPANESAIIVATPPAEAAKVEGIVAEAPAGAGSSPAPGTDALAELLPKMTLEIRAAVDASLQKELAALRTFIGGNLNAHTERLHGDLAALLPAPSAPGLDMPPLVAERRVGARIGWTLAVLAMVGAATMSWLWWNRGAEIAALQTDLTAAYGELETLRSRPEPVAPAAVPTVEAAAVAADPNAVVPAPDAVDAPDAAAAAAQGVDLVPTGGAITPPPAVVPAPAAITPAAATPAATQTSAPVAAAPATPAQ
jgi:hypothetical protein